MSLPSPSVTENIGALIALEAVKRMKANVSIYDPANEITVPYDPETDTGGYTVPALIAGTTAYDPATGKGGVKARIVLRLSPHESVNTVDWSVSRPARIQIPLDAVPTFISKGLLIRVNDGADDPVLLQLAFTVLAAVNGSDAAVRTIECSCGLSATPPIVAP